MSDQELIDVLRKQHRRLHLEDAAEEMLEALHAARMHLECPDDEVQRHCAYLIVCQAIEKAEGIGPVVYRTAETEPTSERLIRECSMAIAGSQVVPSSEFRVPS